MRSGNDIEAVLVWSRLGQTVLSRTVLPRHESVGKVGGQPAVLRKEKEFAVFRPGETPAVRM